MLKKCILLLLFPLFTWAQEQKIVQRIEPANWWVGMKNTSVQILLYGKNIQNLEVRLNAKYVQIEQIYRPENPNYLFLYTRISPNATPEKASIELVKNNKTLEKHTFELKERDVHSADRKGFSSSDMIYLITPDRFVNGDESNDALPNYVDKLNRSKLDGRHGGDLQGIINQLDYIEKLGVTALWLNPVLENAQPQASYHGYAITDFYKVDPRYGSNELYLTLAREAKKRGIKLIIDGVLNHAGSEHWMVKDLPMKDFLNYQEKPVMTTHRRETIQDPYATQADKKKHADGWFVTTMPDLNQRNPHLAKYLIQNTIWWVEYAQLGGIRMDTYSYPDADFMAEWSKAVMNEYPNFSIVGEEWSTNPAIVSYWQRDKKNSNGYTSALPSLMDFPLQEAIIQSVKEKQNPWDPKWISIYSALANDFLYPHPNDLVIFADNHDMSRVFTQINEDKLGLKQALVFLATTRGIPQIYYGTEVLLTNPKSDDHGEIRADMPGGWPTDTASVFTGKNLRVDQSEMLAFTQKLFQWRKNNAVIHQGKLTHYSPQNGIYTYFRYMNNEKVMVVLNKNKQPLTVSLADYAEMTSGLQTSEPILAEGAEIKPQDIHFTKPGFCIIPLIK